MCLKQQFESVLTSDWLQYIYSLAKSSLVNHLHSFSLNESLSKNSNGIPLLPCVYDRAEIISKNKTAGCWGKESNSQLFRHYQNEDKPSSCRRQARPLSPTLSPLPKSNINLVYYTSLDLTFWSLKYGLWMMASSFMKYNQYLESFVCLWAAWEIAIEGPEKKMGEDMNWGKGTDKARRKTDR